MSERLLLSWLLMVTVSPAIARTGSDPYQAYEAGQYDQALSGFVDRQVERPDDPALALNVGNVHYEMRNYPEADRAFAQAALSPDQSLREEALYNLGNSSYRQGRLEEAVELYKAALELDPDDEDAKFNLEFVRNEIRRRHEEAQKRQQEQQQDPQDQQQQQEQQQQQQEQQQQQPQEQGGDSPQDTDQDGLSDQTETSGENPTDPQNPDSDSDGLPDGAEDLNRNGRLDEGETDPNNPDSDGDGLSDGEEAAAEPQTAAGEAEPESSEALTAEEANRYLDALEEGRPDRRPPQRAKRRRPEKDW